MESSTQPNTSTAVNDNTDKPSVAAESAASDISTSQQNRQIKTSSSFDIKGESTDEDDTTMNDTNTATAAAAKTDNSQSIHRISTAAAVSAGGMQQSTQQEGQSMGIKHEQLKIEQCPTDELDNVKLETDMKSEDTKMEIEPVKQSSDSLQHTNQIATTQNNQTSQSNHPQTQSSTPTNVKQTSVIKTKATNQQEQQLSSTELKIWADSLVNKWWEVFWDPEPDDDEVKEDKVKDVVMPQLEEGNGQAVDKKEEVNKEEEGNKDVIMAETADKKMEIKNGSVVDLTKESKSKEVANGMMATTTSTAEQQKNSIQTIPAASAVPAAHQESPPQPAHQSPQLKHQSNSHPQKHQSNKRLQKLDALFTTTSLGLSLILINQSQITVKEISASSPNANIIKPNDRLVGVNGKTFQEMGISITDKTSFHNTIGILKDIERPMLLMFERYVPINNKQKSTTTTTKVHETMSGAIQLLSSTGQKIGSIKSNVSTRELQYPTTPAANFPNGWVTRTVPRLTTNKEGQQASDLYYYSPQLGYKFRSKPEVQRFLDCVEKVSNGDERIAIGEFRELKRKRLQQQQQKGGTDDGMDMDDVPLTQLHQTRQRKREELTDSEIDESGSSSEDDGEDDIDWYDAHILSYKLDIENGGQPTFTVHFLGDDTSVTYDMALTPKVVRPSVRAWTKRTLELLCWDKGNLLGNDESSSRLCLSSASTSLPEDTEKLAEISQDIQDTAATVNNSSSTMLEYKKLLQEQQYLATKLSPQNDDDEEEDAANDDVAAGPGPAATSSYVKHLKNCIKDSEKVCNWLMGESVMLDVLHKVSEEENSPSDDTTKVSKEDLLSLLLNCARYLNGSLSCNPHDKTVKRKGRKKRRTGYIDGALDHYTFENLSSKALTSDESLGMLLDQLLDKADKSKLSKKSLATLTLVNIVVKMFDDLWTPASDWINKSSDMHSGKSGQFYSYSDVEKHLQLAEEMNLSLIELTEWTDKLATKLSRASSFDMEAWSAIQACTQPVVPSESSSAVSGDDDNCIMSLQRLKDEASPRSVLADHPMGNLNPLGKHTVDSSGLTLPSSLTRGVINDAITIRRWILDLNQAKAVRERTAFVQSIIERYNSLPTLPTPPTGVVSNLSAVLVANTKDSITLLSSNCYSYTHIISNASARLQSSSTNPQDAFLRSKEGVVSALSELIRCPVLSVVEEKLHVREELIDWNAEAQQLMVISATAKLPFEQIEALNNKLAAILSLKSEKRIKICQKLQHNQGIEKEVQNFAIADEKVICATTGTWVRNQYERGSQWLTKYRSITAILKSHEESSPTTRNSTTKYQVDVISISTLLEEQTNLVISFAKESKELTTVKESVMQWADSIDKVVSSDTLTLEEQSQELAKSVHTQPKGIVVDPSSSALDLWTQVFTWRIQLKQGIKTMLDNFPRSQMDGVDYQQMMRLLRSVLSPSIIQGQDFLFTDETSGHPFLVELRRKVILLSFQANTNTLKELKKKDIIESSRRYGKAILEHILDSKADNSLLYTKRVVWLMMVRDFFTRLESDNFVGDVSDAKALYQMCPQDVSVAAGSFMDTSVYALRLQKLIEQADKLGSESFSLLGQCIALLQKNCYLNKESLRQSLVGLSTLQSSFNNEDLKLSVKILRDKAIQKKISSKIKGLTFLMSTFAYSDVFNESEAGQVDSPTNRIHINNLRELHNTTPVTIGFQCKVTGDCLDSEVVRVSIMVKILWDRANEWQTKVTKLIPSTNNQLASVKIDTLISLTEDTIVSKVIMPDLEWLGKTTEIARQVQDRMKTQLFGDEYKGIIDVHNGKLPEGKSLIADNNDLILYRFTGSDMYAALRLALSSTHELAAQLPVMTPEKSTLEWMAKIFNWVGSIQNSGYYNSDEKLVIKIDHALEILEQGHHLFYTVPHEVQLYLRDAFVGLHIFPERFGVTELMGGKYTLGIGLLEWSAILFESLKSDVDKEDKWKENSLGAINSFTSFEQEARTNLGGGATFRDATKFRDTVKDLIEEASNLIIQDDELFSSLSLLPEKMKNNALFQRSLENERIAMEQKQYLEDEERFTNPQRLVDDRYELLDSLMRSLPPTYKTDPIEKLIGKCDDNTLFPGEQSARDKSRFALEKCLHNGIETLGMDPKEEEIQDFCSIFAWDLEQAVYLKYHSRYEFVERVSNEYRDKIMSLRFNLQDPKNPMKVRVSTVF